ncbi:1-phosphofructokinase family hexose kinase [Nocardia sp. NPDC004722]
MILTVTPNPALDVTYRVDRFRPAGSNRVLGKAERAGGKGINVARVLHALEYRAVVTGFVGGPTGETLRLDLGTAGLSDHLLPIEGDCRRTVAVVDETHGDTTMLLEPGPMIAPVDWDRLVSHVDGLLAEATGAVFSGSLPPGAPGDAYAQLVHLAHAHRVPAVVDADGAALIAALPAGPDLIKPNVDELTAATGLADPIAAARTLLDAGAGAVVASLGPDGLIAMTPQGGWHAHPPERLSGNATGAGDAAVAALTLGLVAASPWCERMVEAVALSGAAVAAPLAGEFDPDVYQRLRDRVDVHALRSS